MRLSPATVFDQAFPAEWEKSFVVVAVLTVFLIIFLRIENAVLTKLTLDTTALGCEFVMSCKAPADVKLPWYGLGV